MEFKIIDNTKGKYSVSSTGEIINNKTLKTIKQRVRKKDGYSQIGLPINGKQKTFKVHRLVLLTFSPVANADSLVVNHKNWNRLDNRLENLEWLSISQNTRHRKPKSKCFSLLKYLLQKHGEAAVENKLLELNR